MEAGTSVLLCVLMPWLDGTSLQTAVEATAPILGSALLLWSTAVSLWTAVETVLCMPMCCLQLCAGNDQQLNTVKLRCTEVASMGGLHRSFNNTGSVVRKLSQTRFELRYEESTI